LAKADAYRLEARWSGLYGMRARSSVLSDTVALSFSSGRQGRPTVCPRRWKPDGCTAPRSLYTRIPHGRAIPSTRH